NEETLNGPVPTGAVATSDDRSAIGRVTSVGSNSAAAGRVIFTTTVVGSDAEIVMPFITVVASIALAGSWAHFIIAAAESAVNALPFWKVTPERTCNVSVMPSALISHDVARFGNNAPRAPTLTNES